MRMTRILVLGFIVCSMSATAFSQDRSKPEQKTEHFAAVAYSPQRAAAMSNVDIRVKAYTDDTETKRLAALLVEGGQDALVNALEKLPEIGSIQLSGRVGFYDFRLIRSRPTQTGRRVVAVCDRPLAFGEVYSGSRSSDYKIGIMVLDLKTDEKGKEAGTGTLYYATKVKIKNGKVQIEHYARDPIRLVNVRKY